VDFVLFLLVTAIMIVRPADFVPGLEGANLYLIAIVPCILLSSHKVIPQLTTAGLRERPVLVFGIGILLVSMISNLVHVQFQAGFDFATEFLKILMFYLLMLGHIDSPARLRLFLRFLVGIILIPILLAVLNYHGTITIPAFRVLSEGDDVRRLCGSGVFADPNDVCEILNCGMLLCLYGLLDRAGGLTRVLWLAPIALFVHALTLTQSRGGLLGAVVGLMVLFRSRFRGTKSLVAAGAALTVMFVLFGGRQTSLGTSEGTSQSRIQLWDAGFEMFKGSPLIGVGTGQFAENAGQVAHNAFIQTYAELGFLGGTLLFGQYLWGLKNMTKLGSRQVTLPNPEVRRVQPFLLASLASYATSEMSLTHPSSLITYVMFGLATVCIRLADPSPPLPDLLLNRALIRRMVIFSSLFLAAFYVFTRLSVRYG
jgi:putative inorganic carbon (hco3(-)) transporter